MRFWKFFLSLVLSLVIGLFAGAFFRPAFSEGEFLVDLIVKYDVQDSGKTLVTHDISLENAFSTLYATSYTLSLENIDAQNIKATDDKGNTLNVDVKKDGDKQDVKISFSDAVVGKGAKRHFFVTYTNSSFAVKTGEVWEVSIPRISDDKSFRNYNVILSIPSQFGLEAYISPLPQKSEVISTGRTYTFSKTQVSQIGITAGFGQFQVFSFNLSYHLENPLAKISETQIALPPDSAFQKVYFTKIDPKPQDVQIDEDGNWLAKFRLSPLERVDVNVVGSVQIFAGHRPFPKPSQTTLSDNLKETTYWQVNDPQIKALAAQLKTPEAIYKYVSTTLKYDFTRVQSNVQRFGAIKALQNPTQAICMEYTDLFIAIARAAGIPAREINGYAYTENPELQPLSLVADVLHSWPEYYDANAGAWIPVDPTWGSTTGGVDYFSKLDLRHFTFVIHGSDSVKPYPPGSYKLGPNPQKDVFVSFGKLSENRISTPTLTATVKRSLPFLPSIYSVNILNPGPEALYSIYPTVYFDNKEQLRDFIEALPPYAARSFDINVPFSILGKDTPDKVKVSVLDTQITIPTNKTQIVINSLLLLFVVIIFLVVFVMVRLKKITFDKLAATIRSIYDKLTGKSQKNQNPQAPLP